MEHVGQLGFDEGVNATMTGPSIDQWRGGLSKWGPWASVLVCLLALVFYAGAVLANYESRINTMESEVSGLRSEMRAMRDSQAASARDIRWIRQAIERNSP